MDSVINLRNIAKEEYVIKEAVNLIRNDEVSYGTIDDYIFLLCIDSFKRYERLMAGIKAAL